MIVVSQFSPSKSVVAQISLPASSYLLSVFIWVILNIIMLCPNQIRWSNYLLSLLPNLKIRYRIFSLEQGRKLGKSFVSFLSLTPDNQSVTKSNHCGLLAVSCIIYFSSLEPLLCPSIFYLLLLDQYRSLQTGLSICTPCPFCPPMHWKLLWPRSSLHQLS